MTISLDEAYDELAEPVFVLGPDLIVEQLNPAAEQFWARSHAHLVGTALPVMLGPNQALAHLCARAQQQNAALKAFDVEVDRRFQGTVVCNASVAPLHQGGRILVLLVQGSNSPHADHVSTSGRATESLHHLVSMLAHEIKNPLAGIKGAAQLLALSSHDGDDELSNLIIEEADRLTDLVDQFDFFSNSVETQKCFVNVHEALVRVQGIAENSFGKHVTFVTRYDPSLPEVWGDRDRLVQVFLNLVKNACEAVHDLADPVVTLITRYRHGNKAVVGDGARHNVVHAPLQVVVCDNGPGVPTALGSKVFEPFRSGKAQGMGLGLSIVTKILAEHSAGIELQSEPGDTVFTISFPLDLG